MKLFTASANQDLDEILVHIAIAIQLTPTQFDRAKAHYTAVGRWLAEGTLASFNPQIFPQGSLLLDTTVKPLEHAEFDLDLICLLDDIKPRVAPAAVYDLVLEQMTSNGRYEPIVSPERRCIRINYAGDFHLDIVPAIRDPNCGPNETCILIPDRKKRTWAPSNPKGFASWFHSRTTVRTKTAELYERAHVEPLNGSVPARHKPPLKIAVQLLKRWRDVAFKGQMELAPSSIVLTTMAARLYNGERDAVDALMSILDGIVAWASREPIRFHNPSNFKELLTERWSEDDEAYQAFLEQAADFRSRWHELLQAGVFPAIAIELKALFAEQAVQRAMKQFAGKRVDARGGRTLLMERATGTLGFGSAGSAAPSLGGGLMVKPHHFHGE